jgi:hypothetical protein
VYKPHGYSIIVDPACPRPLEHDTVQCGHCNGHIRVKPGTGQTVYLLPTDTPGIYREEGGCFCGKCATFICVRCHHAGKCRPFELWLDQQEARIRNKLGWGRFFRFMGLS